MSRNDSSLVTGLSSATARRVAERRKLAAQENKSKGAQLKPHAQQIMDWIAQEKAEIVNIEKLVLDVSNEKNLQAQILAIQMHTNFLNSLAAKASKLLRAEANHE